MQLEMKPKILIVGESPFSFSGNGHFTNSMASQIDQTKWDVKIFANTKPDIIVDPYNPLPFSLIEGIEGGANFCGEHLCHVLQSTQIDVVIFVGIDCWAYSQVFPNLVQIHKEKKFIWCSIFPFDIYAVRPDWLTYILPLDIPRVYSEYGYQKLKSFVPKLKYFRPLLYKAESFFPINDEERAIERRKIFTSVDDDTFIFGFVGNNQWRKDPLRTIKAFFNARNKIPNSILYMHTETAKGVFNLPAYVIDCGGKPGDVFLKQDNSRFIDMSKIYNTIDCLINSSLQEGLSWTLLEAMLCNCPVIAAKNTSQIELIKNGAGYAIPCTDLAFVPSHSPKGQVSLETRACDLHSLERALIEVATKPKVRNSLIKIGRMRALDWLAHTSNINDLIDDAIRLRYTPIKALSTKQGVLFAQHSAAGDVFMTTRCFEDLKRRHPNEKLTYMTSPQYMDIIQGNPYVDEIVAWNEEKIPNFKFVYNPHGDRILPGHWGRNSNSLLSDFYWKILLIEKPGDFFIEKVRPSAKIASLIEAKNKIVILHTTGGDIEFRVYKYMGEVAKNLKEKGYFTIQLGGKTDYSADAELDLRGKLLFRESAWVVNRASYAITVDSFMSHLCGALGISQICLFGSGNAAVVKPNQMFGQLICMSPDYIKYCLGLGPCSASVRECPIPCTGTHDPKDILKNFNLLIGGPIV